MAGTPPGGGSPRGTAETGAASVAAGSAPAPALASPTAPTAPAARGLGAALADPHLRFLLIVSVLIVLGSAWASGGRFVDPYNLQSMAGQLPQLGFFAIGIMLSMMSGNGGIDLSGVALANLASIVAARTVPLLVGDADTQPWAYTLSFAAVMLVVGFVGGLVNGLLIARLKLTPILATLGTQLVYAGLGVVLSNGASVPVPYLEPMSAIGNDSLAGIVPYSFVLFVAVVAAAGWVLARTSFGLQLRLLGTNHRAAYYAGIDPARILVRTYVACGLLAAVAGLIGVSLTSSARWDYGSSYLLIAILIAVMAGVNPSGGRGSALNLLFAAAVLQLMASTFNLLELSQFFADCAWGALLLLSLLFTRWRAGAPLLPRRHRAPSAASAASAAAAPSARLPPSGPSAPR